MKWSWLRAAILGFLLAPAPLAASEVVDVDLEREGFAAGGRIGLAVRGPQFYVWSEDAREAAEWARELASSADRAGIDAAGWRALAADHAAAGAILTEEREAELELWIEASRDGDRGSVLGLLLCLLPSLDRTAIVASWATSPREDARRVLATALSAPFEAVGVRGAIEHLEGDPSPEVRRLARSAAATRGASLG